MEIFSVIRLLAAGLGLGLGLLVILPGPNVWLFRLSVVATEYGHWVVLVPLLAVICGRWSGWMGGVTVVMGLSGMGLLLSSAVRAEWRSRSVAEEMTAIFGASGVEMKRAPFSWWRMWRGVERSGVVPEIYRFAERDGEALRMIFYRSVRRSPAPCVVVVHGGGWDGGTATEHGEFCEYLAGLGYGVASVEYRLAPKHVWPAQRDDVLAAIEDLKARAGELGIDGGNLVMMGRSAGGQIAEAVAYGSGDKAIRGCVGFYAPADMAFAYKYARKDDLIGSLGLVVRYMGKRPEEDEGHYEGASGIRLAVQGSPPTLLIHGGRDSYVWSRQSERLAGRLSELGVKNYLLELPWAGHGFDFNPWGPGGQISGYAVERFLAVVTGEG